MPYFEGLEVHEDNEPDEEREMCSDCGQYYDEDDCCGCGDSEEPDHKLDEKGYKIKSPHAPKPVEEEKRKKKKRLTTLFKKLKKKEGDNYDSA